VCGLEERGEFGLAAAPSFYLRAHAQGERLGLFERGDTLGGQALGAGEQHRLLVGVGGRSSGQEFQERRFRAVGGALG
jgi:myosin-crossreactive antigen